MRHNNAPSSALPSQHTMRQNFLIAYSSSTSMSRSTPSFLIQHPVLSLPAIYISVPQFIIARRFRAPAGICVRCHDVPALSYLPPHTLSSIMVRHSAPSSCIITCRRASLSCISMHHSVAAIRLFMHHHAPP